MDYVAQGPTVLKRQRDRNRQRRASFDCLWIHRPRLRNVASVECFDQQLRERISAFGTDESIRRDETADPGFPEGYRFEALHSDVVAVRQFGPSRVEQLHNLFADNFSIQLAAEFGDEADIRVANHEPDGFARYILLADLQTEQVGPVAFPVGIVLNQLSVVAEQRLDRRTADRGAFDGRSRNSSKSHAFLQPEIRARSRFRDADEDDRNPSLPPLFTGRHSPL